MVSHGSLAIVWRDRLVVAVVPDMLQDFCVGYKDLKS